MPKPDFTDMLDTACRSAGLDPETDLSAGSCKRSRSGAAAQLHQLADRILGLADRASAAATSFDPYMEHQPDSAATLQESKPSDPRAVADELRITPQMSFSDLARLRRKFALANHPDRVGSAERADATRRMMVANMLIDRELKRRAAARLAARR